MSHETVRGPRRIVCLIEETTETLYVLGEEARIVAALTDGVQQLQHMVKRWAQAQA